MEMYACITNVGHFFQLSGIGRTLRNYLIWSEFRYQLTHLPDVPGVSAVEVLRFVTDSLIVWVVDEKKAVTGVGAVMDVDGNVCCIVLVMTFCVVIFVDDEPAEVKTEMNWMEEPLCSNVTYFISPS